MHTEQGSELDADEFRLLGIGVRFAQRCGCETCGLFLELHRRWHGEAALRLSIRFLEKPDLMLRALVEKWTVERIVRELRGELRDA